MHSRDPSILMVFPFKSSLSKTLSTFPSGMWNDLTFDNNYYVQVYSIRFKEDW